VPPAELAADERGDGAVSVRVLGRRDDRNAVALDYMKGEGQRYRGLDAN